MKSSEANEKIKRFLFEIVYVCQKFGLSLSHEDGHGAFAVEKYDKHNIEWLKDALDWTEKSDTETTGENE